VWYRDRYVEACEQCGGAFGGAAVTGGELLLCTGCERDEAFALWTQALAEQDKAARTLHTRRRLNARKKESDGTTTTR
jgi:ribosome-binding protein aMBF1 (putative translation factor)